MQSAYGLYRINKCGKAVIVEGEESPDRILEIRELSLRCLVRTIELDTGFECPWTTVEDFIVKEFKPFFKLKQAPLPSLRYDMMSYFK